MTQYKRNYELKNAAKDKLEGKYTGAILILVLSSLISNVVTLFIDSIGSATLNTIYRMSGPGAAYAAITVIFNVLLILAGIICAVMDVGVTLYFLNLACNLPLSFSNLFYGFRTDSKKSLAVAAAIVLCRTACLLPFQYLAQTLLRTRDLKWLLYAGITFGTGLFIYVTVALGITLSYYLMLDFPQYSAKETLVLCWRTMRGQRRRLFFLELSFLPLMLLCILSFGIGFLWLEPYMQMTYTCFFLDLMNPQSKK